MAPKQPVNVDAITQDEASLRPRDPSSGEPLPPTAQPGYYAGFSTMGQQAFWEPATRNLVTERVNEPPPRRFFTPEQWEFWTAVFDHMVPQHDRTPNRRVPLVPPLDKRLHEDRTAGYRFESMPPDREIYTSCGIEAIDAETRAQTGASRFVDLSFHDGERVLLALHDGKPKGDTAVWKRMDIQRFWQLILGDALESYYSHPWAWDEIGFGGPAYPRAYTRLERGEPEPWEVEEGRYEWLAPAASLSGDVPPSDLHHTETGQRGALFGFGKKRGGTR